MRAVILTSPFTKCGIREYVENLVAAMPREEVNIDLVRLNRRWVPELLKLLRSKPRPQVVHCQHEFAFFGRPEGFWAIPGFLFLKMLSVMFGFRIIVTFHTIWAPEDVREGLQRLERPSWTVRPGQGYVRMYYRLLSFLASSVVVPTEEGVQVLRAYGISKARFIPLGLYPARPTPPQAVQQFRAERLVIPEGAAMLLLFGFAFESKGYHHVVAALPTLLKRDSAVKLVITAGLPDSNPGQGERYLARLRGLVEELGLQAHVTFLGFVSHDQVPLLIKSADVAVFPFDERSSSSASLSEVLAYEVPLVTSRAAVFRFLRDGQECLKVEPEDHAALADAMERLCHDESLRSEISANLRNLVSRLSIRSSAVQHLSLYASSWSES